MPRSWSGKRDALIAGLVGALALILFIRTLAPTVAFLFDDTLEFQYVVPRLGILHPTGYPFYTLLGKAFTLLVPFNDPAFRLNLLSALNAALAVSMVYFVLHHLADNRFAAALGALIFAVGQTFWSQAVIAETYTTQMLLVAVLFYLVLIWREEIEAGDATKALRRWFALAFAMGLGLTHHRLILLLYPALVVYILLVIRAAGVPLPSRQTWARTAACFFAPLLLYLYLPLRGAVGSADGTYENSILGFLEWVAASKYTVFLTGNPFQVQRDFAYYQSLFLDQLGLLGLALAAMGGVWLLRRRREWILIFMALVTEAAFAFNYRVANVHVHFLTTFLLLAILAGMGADGLLAVGSRVGFRNWPVRFLTPLVAILLLLIPAGLVDANYARNDLSAKWDMHDYGVEMLSQPLEPKATVIGILGEMSLIRYLQENQGMRPDIKTVAADEEEARLAAVDRAIRAQETVYLTRSLKGVAEKYALGSAGPLIRVYAQPPEEIPSISHPLDQDLGGAVKLIGYDLNTSRLEPIPGQWHVANGRRINVTLYWQVLGKIENDAMVSVKILGKDRHAVGQIDHRPVLGAYPTVNWRAGQVVVDSYSVPVFLGAAPGQYDLSVTLYDAQTGASIAQSTIAPIALQGDALATPHELWNISKVSGADFGAFSLAGYSLNTEGPVRPGDALPLTLLWRAGPNPMREDLVLRVWLEDKGGKAASSREASVGNGFPVSQWQPLQYVRDWPLIRVPANVAGGKYIVKLAAARGKDLVGRTWSPSGPTIVTLGQIDVKERPHVLTAPAVSHSRETAFGQKIRLLGYDLDTDVGTQGMRLTLQWRALALMDTSYSIFIHLLDEKGSVVSAADALPAGGDLPTTGWIENEYITDVHLLPVPADLPRGGYRIEIGLYDPVSGVRLKSADGQDHLILETLNLPG